MFRCIPCINTKVLLEDVTNQMKGVSLHSHRQLRPMRSLGLSPDSAPAVTNEMVEAIESLNKERNKKQHQPEMVMGDGVRCQHDHVEQENGGLEEGQNEEEEELWVAEADRGVLITFVSLPNGGNRINTIRFRKDMFDTSEAQKWWNDNYEKMLNLYSIQRTYASPLQSHDESPSTSAQKSSHTQTAGNSDYKTASSSSSGPANSGKTSTGGQERRTVIPGRLVEWVVEDEPGVFITVRSLSDGNKEIRRVELSRERFGEVKARVWWEENKDRVHRQYT